MLDGLVRGVLTMLERLVAAVPDAGDLGLSPARDFTSVLAALDAVTGIGGPLAFLLGLLSAAPALASLRLATWAYRLIPGKMT